ncbi:hypothetical protein F5B20DRAFT_586300 [Whalleya microplaca]|nr:hypothetical protein F5B20DRAFT_586300 [Whalleya microplaca]
MSAYHLPTHTIWGIEDTILRLFLGETASIAIDLFRAVFRERLTDENFLINSPENKVLDTLQAWAKDLAPSSMNKRDIRSTLSECTSALMRLTSENNSDDASADEPAVWPYIKKIKVYLNAHILSKGLILVDLPGLRDRNSARRHITERYILRCDEIFVVCNEGRATTDVGVEVVFELAKKARLENVGIICTRSDDIKAEEAKKDWKGQKARDVQQMIDDIGRSQRDVDTLESDLVEFDQIDGDFTKEDRDEHIGLIRSLRKAKNQRYDLAFKLHHYLIGNRNDIVKGKLLNLYRDQVSDGKLVVFCVSNSLYWDHRDSPKATALPRLTLSGTLEVREHCMATVLESQCLLVTKYIRNDISVLLGEVELWVQSGSRSMDAERKQILREALDTLESRLKRGLCDNAAEINGIAGEFRQKFLADIYRLHRNRTSVWSEAASKASQVWSGWHPYTELSESSGSAAALSSTMSSHQRLLVEEIESVYSSFEDNLNTLQTDSLSSIRSSFVGKAMDDSYRACIHESGRGSDARRKIIINNAVGRESLFKGLLDNFRKGFDAVTDELQKDIQNAVRAHLDNI